MTWARNSELVTRPLPLHITTCGGFNSIGHVLAINGGLGFASGGWTGNNRAIYIPVLIPARFTVARFLSANGNATGNTDIGIYNANGVLLLSTGSTARSGAPAVQYIDVTNQAFPAGKYYLAMVVSTTAGNVFRSGSANLSDLQACGILQENLGGTTLPATMTPAAYANTNVYNWGFTQSDTL